MGIHVCMGDMKTEYVGHNENRGTETEYIGHIKLI